MSQRKALRDIFLLIAGARLLGKVGITPGSFYGGTALGFFGGNMAGVYGFDARETLSTVASASGIKVPAESDMPTLPKVSINVSTTSVDTTSKVPAE